MWNIWYIYGLMILVWIGVIIVGIYITVTKEKGYIIWDLLLAVFFVYTFIVDIPYLQDLMYQETEEIIGVYDCYQKRNVGALNAFKLHFEIGDEEIELIAPRWAFIVPNMEEGRAYRVIFFKNTKVIKEFHLIE